MPQFDGTGPLGRGPMTGRGMGFCVVRIPDDDRQGSTSFTGPLTAETRNTIPRGDRTGPTGMGPMTGRAAGYCAGSAVPGFMNPIAGRGYWGRGRGGGGRGWRNQFYATGLYGWHRAKAGAPAFGGPGAYIGPLGPVVTEQQELDALKGQAELFQNALEEIRKRLDELQGTTVTKQK